MMDTRQKNLDLPWQALLVAVLPFLVYMFNDQLLDKYGEFSGARPTVPADANGLQESGARLQFLAALLFFTGSAAAVMAAFGLSLQTLSADARRRSIWGVSTFTLIAVIALSLRSDINPLRTRGIASDIGLADRCPLPRPETGECATRYADLISLLDVWKWTLTAATLALIFGIICCLAVSPPTSTERIRASTLKQQAIRLNLFLYLAGVLMVSVLLVQIAFLRWPRFAVPASDLAHFDAYVSAVILYYGVGYSVFLASFYVPAIYTLGWRADRLTNQKLRVEILEGTAAGPAHLAKQVGTIIAPALTALVTASISLLD